MPAGGPIPLPGASTPLCRPLPRAPSWTPLRGRTRSSCSRRCARCARGHHPPATAAPGGCARAAKGSGRLGSVVSVLEGGRGQGRRAAQRRRACGALAAPAPLGLSGLKQLLGRGAAPFRLRDAGSRRATRSHELSPRPEHLQPLPRLGHGPAHLLDRLQHHALLRRELLHVLRMDGRAGAWARARMGAGADGRAWTPARGGRRGRQASRAAPSGRRTRKRAPTLHPSAARALSTNTSDESWNTSKTFSRFSSSDRPLRLDWRGRAERDSWARHTVTLCALRRCAVRQGRLTGVRHLQGPCKALRI